MQEGGHLLVEILNQVISTVSPGVKLLDLEDLVVSLIAKTGGRASFKEVSGYHWATCLNINQGVVHGVPFDYRLQKGDLLSVDAGLYHRGFHTDAARSFMIAPSESKTSKQSDLFLNAGRRALKAAIAAAVPGNRVGHLSRAIEKEIRAGGYRPVEELTGHGVGRKLHEDPSIPCFVSQPVGKTPELKPGMVLAVEVIYAVGTAKISVLEDGWTVETADGSLAGLFEETVAVTAKGPLVLTK